MQVKKKRKRRYAAPIGGIFLFLALVGIITVVMACLKLTGRVLDNTPEKEKLESIIRPVLMFDPVPFESPADLDNKQLLLYSMWYNLAGEKRATYTYDENAELVIPPSDLDVAAARLFGPEIQLTYETFDDYQTTYYYDAENNRFTVPVSAQLYVYSPQVEEIERVQGDVYNVTVGYIPAGNAWTTDFTGNRGQPAPDKRMIYVMRKTGSSYQIMALRDMSGEPTTEGGLPAVPQAG